jgi:hypothetical protein
MKKGTSRPSVAVVREGPYAVFQSSVGEEEEGLQ